MSQMTYGLMAFGSALGVPAAVDTVVGEYTEDVERVRAYGYRTVHRCLPGVGVTDLAHQAAEQALEVAGVAAGEVDLVVLALTDIAEYLYWDPVARLQSELGAAKAETLLVTQACTAGIIGLDLIAGRFATRPDYRTALLVAANRSCETYWNRMETQSMVFSDGAVATVVRRDHPRNRVLATDSMTDGAYADFYRMDVGGAAQPFEPGADKAQARDAWDIMEFFDFDDERFLAFVRMLNARGRLVVQRACERAGVPLSSLARLFYLHDNLPSMQAIADEFGLPLTRTNAQTGFAVGHLGAADQLLSLARSLDADEVAEGDRIALLGMGRGMHWASAVIAV
jgi:3-oxoacyl-[acyl-carrier-protein] synthase-3